jgi:PPOX class probable F420-dependent enzyme
VPISFAFVDDDTIVTAVDHKRKQSPRLQRLENIRHNPSATILVDHYAEDWTELWWARLHCRATVVDQPAAADLAPLVAKYDQYRERPPAGPAILLHVVAMKTWAAVGDY